MTTKIIDCSLTGAAFPATYTGAGTLIGNVLNDGGVGQHTTGFFTSTGDAVEIWLGYQPRNIDVINETDGVLWEKTYGMQAANSLKTTSVPTFAVDTGSAITFEDMGSGNWRVLLSAAMVGTSKNIVFSVEG